MIALEEIDALNKPWRTLLGCKIFSSSFFQNIGGVKNF